MTGGTPANVRKRSLSAVHLSSPLPPSFVCAAGGEDRLFESFLSISSWQSRFLENISTGGFPAILRRPPFSAAAEGTGTTGIMIDNAASATNQADSIYFGTLTTNTAVKLTQSTLPVGFLNGTAPRATHMFYRYSDLGWRMN